jgi:signal transduction histidine kinase
VPVIDQEGKLILFDGIITDITERKVADRVLQSYYTSITAAHEEERKKIARELHDETLQSLSMVLNNLNEAFLMCKESAPEISLQLKNISTTLRDMMDGLRRFSHELRPSLLDKFGLVPSLEMLTEEVGRQGSLECHLEIVNSEQRIPDEAELALFRIAQEALQNVRKHSKATEAVVSIEFNESKATLSVTDNGIGFQVDRWQSELAQSGKFGLIGMRERASLLGGQLTVESEMGKGTTIRVEIPSDIKTHN